MGIATLLGCLWPKKATTGETFCDFCFTNGNMLTFLELSTKCLILLGIIWVSVVLGEVMLAAVRVDRSNIFCE